MYRKLMVGKGILRVILCWVKLGYVGLDILYVTLWRSLILGRMKVGNPKTHTPRISAIVSKCVYVYDVIYESEEIFRSDISYIIYAIMECLY